MATLDTTAALADLATELAADAARIARALDSRSGRRAEAPSRSLLRAEELLTQQAAVPTERPHETRARALEAVTLAAVALAEARAALEASGDAAERRPPRAVESEARSPL